MPYRKLLIVTTEEAEALRQKIERLKDCNLKLVVDGSNWQRRAHRAEEKLRGLKRLARRAVMSAACLSGVAYVTAAMEASGHPENTGGASATCEADIPDNEPSDFPTDLPVQAYPGACVLLSASQRQAIEDALQMSLTCERVAILWPRTERERVRFALDRILAPLRGIYAPRSFYAL